MTSLSALAHRIKTVFLPFTIAFIVIGLSVVIYLQFAQKQRGRDTTTQTPKINSLPIKTSSFSSSIKDFQVNYPDSLSIFTKEDIDLRQQAGNIAAKLSIKSQQIPIKDTKLGEGYMYKSNEKVIIVYKNQFSFSSLAPKNSKTKTTEENLKSVASSLLSGFLQEQALPLSNAATSYLKIVGETSKPVESQTQADIVRVNYYTMASGLNVFPPTATIDLTPEGDIVSFSYAPIFATQERKVTIIKPKNALEQLYKGEGFLVSIQGTNSDTTTLKSLENVDIQKAYLAYYYDPHAGQKIVSPVWVFEGQSKLVNDTVKVTYVVSAVSN